MHQLVLCRTNILIFAIRSLKAPSTNLSGSWLIIFSFFFFFLSLINLLGRYLHQYEIHFFIISALKISLYCHFEIASYSNKILKWWKNMENKPAKIIKTQLKWSSLKKFDNPIKSFLLNDIVGFGHSSLKDQSQMAYGSLSMFWETREA